MSSNDAYNKARSLLVQNAPANSQKAQTASKATYDASQKKSNQIIQQKQDNLNQLNSMSSQVAQNNSRNSQVGT